MHYDVLCLVNLHEGTLTLPITTVFNINNPCVNVLGKFQAAQEHYGSAT